MMLEESIERWKGGVREVLKLKSFDRARYNSAIDKAKTFYKDRLPKECSVSDLLDLFWGREFDMELNQMLKDDMNFSFNLLIVKPAAHHYLYKELNTAKNAISEAQKEFA